ncbi:LacI family DNA-binding transcriptional regulator [Microvirga rosea]|uniref:LacI family DNA-binding transcriptional regulator n=1 Tax=Microvirga rosea TaxID=2715425 RepID=UPI001D0B2328|nr:LacI family DNA-binding transcriptional regulator [Microvirga rosea]MCB8822242.1 LacI family DNA-binding transcriptional regulator [Microvirga rosea]
MAVPEIKPNRTFVSAQRVAELAGVSRSAVSRTFTSGASVSDATRKKVMKAAEALGYHVNHLARGLIHERSDIVCLIAADINTPYQARMLETMTRRLQEIDKVAMVINTSGENESVTGALRKSLNYRADATVVLSGAPNASLIDTCINNGQHIILINRDDHLNGPENIIVDSAIAAREAFHMLRRAGCRKIAVVSSQAGTPSLVGRENAFQLAAAEAGIEVIVARCGPTAYASGAEAARMLLSRSDTPDAAFCVTDLLAFGFMDVARHEFGMSIPNDLCVIGFDDIEQAGWTSYNLTTFRQPIDQIADHIVQHLEKPVDVRQENAPIRLQPLPVWRKSVRPK